MSKIRIQKYCSEQGLASRRQAEEFLQKGWIKVNGVIVTEPGKKIDPQKDRIEFLPSALNIKQTAKYLLLNKPRGLVTNLPQKGEIEANTLLSPVDRKEVSAVGRLDKESEGLLFWTNDGVIANRLKSPEFAIEKEYEVTVDRELTPPIIARCAKGLTLGTEKLKPVFIQKTGRHQYRFILTEGKNRQIRRMLNKFNYTVLKLKRVRIGILELKDLPVGKYRALSKKELAALKKTLLLPQITITADRYNENTAAKILQPFSRNSGKKSVGQNFNCADTARVSQRKNSRNRGLSSTRSRLTFLRRQNNRAQQTDVRTGRI